MIWQTYFCSMTAPQIVDLAIGLLFLVSVLTGYHRGLVVTLARIAALAAAYLGAAAAAKILGNVLGRTILLPMLKKHLEGSAAGLLPEQMLWETVDGIAYSLVFFLLFFVLQVFFLLLIRMLKMVDRIPVVGKLDKLGGAVFGFLWVFILCLLLGNVFFTYVPRSVQKQMGLGKRAVENTVLLNVFVP